MELSEEEKQKKAQAQHDAWKRWYDSPKGQAYKQKRKERTALAKSTEAK